MDLAGFDWVLVETVGVGQSEIDIRRIADLTLVVLVPESGDDIQALKAGVLEISDLLIVHKSDRSGSGNLVNTLKEMVQISKRPDVPVLATSSSDTQSIDRLYSSIETLLPLKKADAKRRVNLQKEEKAELVESWVNREVRDWLKKMGESSGNPYEFAIRFSQKWSLPEWKP